MEYFFTAKAEQDFQSIYRYIAQDNPRAAHHVTDCIENTCNMLSDMPGMGKHPEYVLEPTVKVFPVKEHNDYLIFYSEVPDGLLVIRILHGAQDLPVAFYN